jgi:hypothetical protein
MDEARPSAYVPRPEEKKRLIVKLLLALLALLTGFSAADGLRMPAPVLAQDRGVLDGRAIVSESSVFAGHAAGFVVGAALPLALVRALAPIRIRALGNAPHARVATVHRSDRLLQ